MFPERFTWLRPELCIRTMVVVLHVQEVVAKSKQSNIKLQHKCMFIIVSICEMPKKNCWQVQTNIIID